ncbi:MAG TPA: thylakoid-associated protein [Nitrospinae bacterium]|nr:thylakoid-associated protein [Nitrospinota bacterium]
MSRVALVRCEDYDPDRVEDSVARLLELLGGAGKFASPEESILLKPNLLKGAPPESAVTTHPEVLRAVIRVLRRTAPGAALSVGDSPAWGSFESAMRVSGQAAVCTEEGVPATPFHRGVKVPNPEGTVYRHLHIARAAVSTGGVINLPKLKTHCQMYMTGAVKNLFGCVAGKRKAWWHFKAGNFQEYFPLMIVETARLIAPRLSVLDAVVGMEGQGPGSGKPRRAGLLMASTDPVALDRVACEAAGLDPSRLRTLAAAETIGWGQPDLSKIEIAGLPLEEARLAVPFVPPKMIPVGFSLPRVVKSTMKQQWLVRVKEPIRRVS